MFQNIIRKETSVQFYALKESLPPKITEKESNTLLPNLRSLVKTKLNLKKSTEDLDLALSSNGI